MSTPRKLCVFFCVLGFVAICALALTLNTTGRYGFAGRGGIESELVDQAETIIGADAVGAVVTANGRDLTVGLPDVVVASFDRENLTSQLKAIVGVRSVELVGEPSIEVSPDGSGAPEPTAVAAVEPAPTATARTGACADRRTDTCSVDARRGCRWRGPRRPFLRTGYLPNYCRGRRRTRQYRRSVARLLSGICPGSSPYRQCRRS